MKTKALLLTVALGAAGIATSMAQVYSANAVGYINVTVNGTADPLQASLKLIANQLIQQAPANATVGSLCPTAPDFSQLFFLKPDGSFDIATFFGGAWDHPEYVMALGGAAFAANVDAAPWTITFVGEVPTGTLSNPIPPGLSMKSSMVPQMGTIESLGFGPANDFDQIFSYNTVTKSFDISTYFGGSYDALYTIGVGEGLYIFADPSAGAHAPWVRIFSL